MSFPKSYSIPNPFFHSYQPLHPNRFWVRSYCPRRSVCHQLDPHQPIPKKSRFWLKQQMLQKWQKAWILPSHPWCCRSISSKIPYSTFIPHLISYHARYFLRKHRRKSRNLTVPLLKMILPSLMFKLSTPQSRTQLMVRKSHAQFISL